MATHHKTLGLALLCWLYASVASADPVQVTSGSAMVQDGGGTFLTFAVAGPLFSATGSWDIGTLDFHAACASGCAPGASITLSSMAFNDSLLTAEVGELGAGALITATGAPVNGGRVVELLGKVSFSTPTVTLPAPAAGASGLTLMAPFTLTGTVQGYNPFARDPRLLFSQEVGGTGLATLTLPFNPWTQTYSMVGTLRYDFQTPAPTPEPGSLLLLSTGILVFGRTRQQSCEIIVKRGRPEPASIPGRSPA